MSNIKGLTHGKTIARCSILVGILLSALPVAEIFLSTLGVNASARMLACAHVPREGGYRARCSILVGILLSALPVAEILLSTLGVNASGRMLACAHVATPEGGYRARCSILRWGILFMRALSRTGLKPSPPQGCAALPHTLRVGHMHERDCCAGSSACIE